MASKQRVPTSDGWSVQWSRSAGSYNYALVDEYPSTDDTDYIYSASANSTDHYNYTPFDVPAGAVITNVKVYIRGWSVNNNIGVKCGPLLMIGYQEVQDFTQTEIYFGSGIVEKSFTWTTNPVSGEAWTVDDVNGVVNGNFFLHGFGCFSPLSPEAQFRVYRIYLEVNYTGGGKASAFII